MKHMMMKVAVPLLCSLSASAMTPHFIQFDQPFVMTKQAVRVEIDKVSEGFDKKTNSWVEKNTKKENVPCDLEIRIAGRDMANGNALIGEHYTGNLALKCAISGKSVVFNFGRTMFLGIRNCVSSETYTDSDYCDIYAVGLSQEKDLFASGGPMIKNETEKREYYRVKSPAADADVAKYNLIPQGVRATTILGTQILKLSVGQAGDSVFIEKPNTKSGLEKGNNLYMSVPQQSVDRDLALRGKVEASIKELAQILKSVTGSTNPAQALQTAAPEFLTGFSDAMKDLLSIVSPVHFMQLESALLQQEANMTKLWAQLLPQRGITESVGVQYSELLSDYQKLKNYADEKNKGNKILNQSLSAIYQKVSIDSAVVSRPKKLIAFDEDKTFFAQTAIYRWGAESAQAQVNADAICVAYLTEYGVEFKSRYKCVLEREWVNRTVNEAYAIFRLQKF